MTKFRMFDTETTGFPPNASVVEIGFTDIEWDPDNPSAGATIHAPKSHLCKPSHPINIEAMAVHHITEAMVRDAPHNTEVLDMLLLDAQSSGVDYFVAHNAKFDRAFFNPDAYLQRWICSLKLSYVLFPEAPKNSNQVLRYYLGVDSDFDPAALEDVEPHRAGFDTYVSAHIFARELKEGHQKWGPRMIEEMLATTNAPTLLNTVPFGKWKGRPWKTVETSYLQWILGNAQAEEDVRHTARYWLKQRGFAP